MWRLSDSTHVHGMPCWENSTEGYSPNVKINPIHSTQWNRIILINWSAVTDSFLGETLNQVLDNFFESAPENVWLSTSSCLLPISKFPSNKLIPGTPFWFGCSLSSTMLTPDFKLKKYLHLCMDIFASFQVHYTVVWDCVQCIPYETFSHTCKLLNILALLQGS